MQAVHGDLCRKEEVYSMNKKERIEMLRKIPFFQKLKDNVMEKISGLVLEEKVSAGEVLFEQGDPGDSMYIVLSGEGTVLKTIEDEGKKRQKSLGFVEKDVLFGEMAFFDEQPRSATIKANTDMKLLKLKKDDLEQFFMEDSQSASIVFYEVIKVISGKLRDSARELVTVYETGKAIALSNSEEEFLARAFNIVIEGVLNEDSGILAIYNEFTEELEIKNHKGFSFEEGDLGDGYISRQEPLVRILMDNREAYEGNPSEKELLKEGNFSKAKSLVAAPIFSGDKFRGIFAMFNHNREEAFTSSERNLISAVASQIALALENVSLRQEYKNLERLGRTIW